MTKTLRQRLWAAINQVPAVDIHSHIDFRRPAASDISDIVFYHYIVSELIAAGMPVEKISSEKSPRDRLRSALPFLPRIANTSTFWVLRCIIRDLYGIEKPADESAWMALCDRVEAQAADSDRASAVLTQYARVRRTFLTLPWDATWEGIDHRLFAPTVRVEALASRPWGRDRVQILEEKVQHVIRQAADIERAMQALVGSWKAKGVVAIAVSFERERPWDWSAPSPSRVDAALRALQRGEALSSREADDLNVFAWRSLLAACSDERIPVQIMLGISRLPGGLRLPVIRPHILAALVTLFADFPRLHFDIALANPVQSHELASYAKMHPNVFVAGYWWYALNPSVIRRMLRERIEMLPGNKINGFFSDAYCVEWSYGKAQLVRRQVVHVLADMVEEGYLGEEQAIELATDLLDRNPGRLYLGEGMEGVST